MNSDRFPNRTLAMKLPMRWIAVNLLMIPSPCKGFLRSRIRTKARRNGFCPLRRAELLEELQYCLLSLVCLLQRSHSSGLQDVVLRHVAHGLAHVRIHDAIGSTREVLDLGRDDMRCRLQSVNRGANLTALSRDRTHSSVDRRQCCGCVCVILKVLPRKPE